MKTALGAFLLTLLSLQVGLCSPYEWSQPVPPFLIAPSDDVDDTIRGASLQGSLVDLRWGQVCIDVGGTGHLLDWNKQSEFTLNGTKTTAEELAKLVKSGEKVMVALRYDPELGLIGWMDALTQESQSAIELVLEPYRGPALKPGQSLKVSIPAWERRRLKLDGKANLFVPGMVHGLPLPEGEGEFPLLQGWNWRNIPLYVRSGAGQAYRAKTLSVSSSGPEIRGFGPEVAPGLEHVPCWVDLSGSTELLQLRDCRIKSTLGSTITQRVLRDGRLSFVLVVEGPGRYDIEVLLTDQLGREATASWLVNVKP